MALVGDIITSIFGGSGDETKNNSVSTGTQTGTIKDTTDSTKNTQSTQQTGTVQQSQSTVTNDTHGVVRSLDDATIQSGQAVVEALSKNFSPADLSGIIQRVGKTNDAASAGALGLLERAQNADSTLAAGNDAIFAQAQQQGQDALNAKETQAASGAGSKFSSLVANVFAKGETDLTTSLAALKATTAQAQRLQATNELVSAISALSGVSTVTANTEGGLYSTEAQIDATRSSAVANAINAIKGGVTTTDSTQSQTTDTRNETQQTINAISQDTTHSTDTRDLNVNNNQIVVGDKTTTQANSLLDLLNSPYFTKD